MSKSLQHINFEKYQGNSVCHLGKIGVANMEKQERKTYIYLATKLFSFFDRLVSEIMYDSLERVARLSQSSIYLPFRDSNQKVSHEGNVAENIFLADIKALNKTDIFVTRLDGLSYDAGIGFEIGYCIAMEVPIFVFSTDFMRTRIETKMYNLSPLLTELANIFIYEYSYDKEKSYYDELQDNVTRFSRFVTDALEGVDFKAAPTMKNIKEGAVPEVFIDICGCKYEWSRLLSSEIESFLDENGITHWTSNRYSTGYDYKCDFYALSVSKIMIVCYDENEPDIDSCILQGYAYKKKKTIVGYESSNVTYYVEGAQEMHVNFMLEQSCNYIAGDLRSIKKYIKATVSYENKE